MDGIKITGGIPLQGEVKIQGSKNAALPIMAAALLNKGTTVLYDCPRIADVYCMEKILNKMGVDTCWKENRMEIHSEEIRRPEVSYEDGCQMRSSIVLLGSLLGRCREVVLPYPGGCTIGKRPIDMHIRVLNMMGAEFTEKDGKLVAVTTGLKGKNINLERKSVGATQNAILAAACAKGITKITGCSMEPEVTWLCRFLNKAGAFVRGIGTESLTIYGVSELHDTEFFIPKDRIVAGTYVCASAVTRGAGVLVNPPMEEMQALLETYKKIGGQYQYNSGKLILHSFHAYRSVNRLETQVYPGFPTDLQSIFMTVMAVANGESCIIENIFEDRFKIVSQLRKMGASIEICGKNARIKGGKLSGAQVEAMELRGGAALVIAGLAAHGETYVRNRHFIERGYENICRDLTNMGAQILED